MEHASALGGDAAEHAAFAAEIAAAVTSACEAHFDQALEGRTVEFVKKSAKALRDIQAKQKQDTENLSQALNLCIERQQAFAREQRKLTETVNEVLSFLSSGAAASAAVPPTPYVWRGSPAPGSFAGRAGTVGGGTPAGAALTAHCGSLATVYENDAEEQQVQQTSFTFTITLRRADGIGLGLDITLEDGALRVNGVQPGSAVEAWNRQCSSPDRVVWPGDHIIGVNGARGDAQAMLEECQSQRLLKLAVARGDWRAAAADQQAGKPATSTLKSGAPEFVPMSQRVPLKARQEHESFGTPEKTAGSEAAQTPEKTTPPDAARKTRSVDEESVVDKENSRPSSPVCATF